MASAFRILGEGQLSLSKFLLVTDQHVDVRDFRATLEHILARTNPETDLYVLSNLAMDTLDYTGPTVNEGSKGVWMGLGDPIRELPRQFRTADLPLGITDVRVFCGGCLVVGAPSYESERDVVGNHIASTAPVVVDARMKPWYPKELSCRKDIAGLVSRRWREYFPSAAVTMGDSERGHLLLACVEAFGAGAGPESGGFDWETTLPTASTQASSGVRPRSVIRHGLTASRL
jgi:3-polyprenyl-4-hydroxybenzoate decarboxylase